MLPDGRLIIAPPGDGPAFAPASGFGDTLRVIIARLGPRRLWFQLLGVGPLVLLFSLSPSVLYLDHWTEFVHAGRGNVAEVNVEEHQAHCHYGAASCSDQPVPTNMRTLAEIVQLDERALQAIALEDHTGTLLEFIAPIRAQPPRL